MTDDNRKTAALIGAGMVAQTHIDACADAARHVHLKAIVSRRPDRAEALAAAASDKIGAAVVHYSSVDDVATDPQIDFAIIATPPNARIDLVSTLAAAGKHILLEKPVGRTAQQAREVVQICREAGVILGVVFQHRTRQASRAARDLIAKGGLGRLVVAEFDVPWWRAQSYYDEPGRGTYARDGGGVLISQAIHTIDLGLSFTGPVASVTAMAQTTAFHEMESEDYVVAGLTFENGAVGSLTASTASFPGRAESLRLFFEKATLHLEAGMLTATYRDGRVQSFGEEAATGGGADPMAFTHAWHQEILENFVTHLRCDAPLYASGADAMAAHELIDAIVRAAKSGTREVLIP
ncbi:Gfo/Idh/MocA family oxidoreductase [uncultured Roseobacter sp.]|uniref:Gfo/Idh/MocA family protein n=1 Tax=uncultured Roseobacter sp. TaxID=114847 RepID=UPI002611AF3D|nr:Gfo/Idh/MocA family oxidoreductase [uncultured Roseobacter sp.]